MMLTSDHVQTSRGAKHVLAKSFHTLYVTTEGPVSARDRGRKVESCYLYRSDHMLCSWHVSGVHRTEEYRSWQCWFGSEEGLTPTEPRDLRLL